MTEEEQRYAKAWATSRRAGLLAIVGVELDAVTVEFDLVNPLVSLGRLGLQGGELGFNEPRHLGTLHHKRNSLK